MFNASQEALAIFFVCLIVLVAVFAMLVFSVVRKYQAGKVALLRQMEQMRKSHQDTLMEVQLETQEQAFGHIARELHDNVSQKLTLTKLYLNTLPLHDPVAARQSIVHTIELVSAAIKEISDISKSMSNDLIANHGLIKVIELEMNQVQRSGMYAVHTALEGQEYLMETYQEVVLFRIFQEALANIIKHAHATAISVRLIYKPGSFEMQVEDDGVGIGDRSASTGSGIFNMQKRAVYLGGSSTIATNERGTLITIKIPTNGTSKAA